MASVKRDPNERVKTTVMMPRALLERASEMGRILGTGRNGFLSLATGMLLIRTEGLRDDRMRRRQRLTRLQKQFQIIMQQALDKA